MKFIDANEAKKISEANLKSGINSTLYEVLKKIHSATRRGQMQIVFPKLPWAKLGKDDIQKLVNKGYEVEKDEGQYIIRWY